MPHPASQVVLDIRALTTAISLIQPRHATAEPPIRSKLPNYQALSKAYNHLAILLTQGTDKDGAGNLVVAVTGKFDANLGLSVSALHEIEEMEDIQHLDFTQDNLLKVVEITPSGATLEDLADPSKPLTNKTGTIVLTADKIPLDQHASDLFQALIAYSEDRKHLATPFMRFVWLRCSSEMIYRFAADNLMLGMPLSELLGQWTLSDTDEVKKEEFKFTPPMHQHVDKYGIPFRFESTDSRVYLFSRSTIPAWRQMFIDIFQKLKEVANQLKEVKNPCDTQIDLLIKVLNTLNRLLFDNHAFKSLLGLRSLFNAVNDAMVTTEKDRRARQSDDSPEPLLSDECADSDECAASDDSPILRCCKAMVAWTRAGRSLSRSKLFKEPLPKFHIVRSFLPTHIRDMASLPDLMTGIILDEVNRSSRGDFRDVIHRLVLELDLAKTTQFSGKIHCEATLMALVHSFSTTPASAILPFPKKETEELAKLCTNADRVIGVGKKSCFCCYGLAQLLKGSDDTAFLVSGKHGMVFPWTPPEYGVPETVLVELRKKLIEKLTDVTVEWIQKQAAPRSSCQSSRALQSSYDNDEDELYVKE